MQSSVCGSNSAVDNAIQLNSVGTTLVHVILVALYGNPATDCCLQTAAQLAPTALLAKVRTKRRVLLSAGYAVN